MERLLQITRLDRNSMTTAAHDKSQAACANYRDGLGTDQAGCGKYTTAPS
jgi:hypothetical protein